METEFEIKISQKPCSMYDYDTVFTILNIAAGVLSRPENLNKYILKGGKAVDLNLKKKIGSPDIDIITTEFISDRIQNDIISESIKYFSNNKITKDNFEMFNNRTVKDNKQVKKLSLRLCNFIFINSPDYEIDIMESMIAPEEEFEKHHNHTYTTLVNDPGSLFNGKTVTFLKPEELIYDLEFILEDRNRSKNKALKDLDKLETQFSKDKITELKHQKELAGKLAVIITETCGKTLPNVENLRDLDCALYEEDETVINTELLTKFQKITSNIGDLIFITKKIELQNQNKFLELKYRNIEITKYDKTLERLNSLKQ